MLHFKAVSLRNFLSVGNVTQLIRFDDADLTLVIGENVDVGGRNGVGKSTLLQAVCYACFGKPLTQIKADNLVNSYNNKGMLVTVEFERDGKTYRIERGRKPAIMRYFVNDKLIEEPDANEAQGETRNTQTDIDQVLGFSHTMFKHIIALNTFTEPFLKSNAADQREVIEELLGITQLSAKSEQLKGLVKATKAAIRDEEVRIKTQTESNQKITNTISDLELRSRVWVSERSKAIKQAESQLATLGEVDIEAEIEAHAALAEFTAALRQLDNERRHKRTEQSHAKQQVAELSAALREWRHKFSHFELKVCPTCKQSISGDVSDERDAAQREMIDIERRLADQQRELAALSESVAEFDSATLGDAPTTFYDKLDKAYQHRATLESLEAKIAREKAAINPYTDQIETLRAEALVRIDYEPVNDLNTLLKHQEFLVKLLTAKDSFVRKKIINQNLAYLNHRLNGYLDKLGLPHEVRFKSDLAVEITLLGRDFDFEQLSRGEMNRVILGTSWSFRDVWESQNQTVNLMLVDECIDSGLDQQGAEAALDVLKRMARERRKNVLLISHKDELMSRVSRILLVRKENSFTHFHADA